MVLRSRGCPRSRRTCSTSSNEPSIATILLTSEASPAVQRSCTPQSSKIGYIALPARRPKRDIAWTLILERVARPLCQGAGLAPVLWIAERGLHRLGQQEGGQPVGQFRERSFPRLEIRGRADHGCIAALGVDLLLDLADLGPDLGEPIARLLRGSLRFGPPPGLVLRHGRSPCREGVGRRRLSTSSCEERNPAPKDRRFRNAPRTMARTVSTWSWKC